MASFGCSEAGRASQAYDHARAAYIRGDLAEAAREAGDLAKRWEKSPDSPWHWKFRLLAAEILTAQSRYGDVQTLLAQGPPRRPELEQLYARYLIDRAALEITGRGNAAESIREGRQVAREPELLIRLDLVDGALALNRRDHAKAEQLFRAALDRSSNAGDQYLEALALNNLSVTSKRLNRYEASIDYALRAIAAAEKAKSRRTVALAEGNLGTAYAYLGQLDSAIEYEKRAVATNESIGAKSLVMTYLGELGLTYYRAERTADAIAQYRRAYDLANELKSTRDAERFAENLALALIKTQRWDEAAQWNDTAWTLASQTGAKASLPYLTRNRANIAWGRGEVEEAERQCRELLKTHAEQPSITWDTHALLGQIHAAAKRNPEANRDFEAALSTIESTRSDLLDPNFRITLLSRLITFYRDYVDVLVAQDDNLRALRVVDSSRARVLAERLGQNVRPAKIGDAAALRRFARESKLSIVSFWVTPRRSYAWLVDAAGVRRFALPDGAEIEKLVTNYRKVVEHSVVDPLPSAEGRALWDQVLAPIAAEIPKDGRVVVIPDGPLHRLNLETVAAATPAPHYWIEDVEVTVAPSIAILMAKAGAGTPQGGVLAIGAPDYRGSTYQDLPAAKSEIELVRSRFPKAVVKVGADATPAAYRASTPAQFGVIHFAAHAEANEEKPLESAVVLSQSAEGNRLRARDVIGIPIRAELVTLSACRSAGARTYAGEGLMGFAWAFLQAGARSVVAGLWEVNDDASGALMAKFYEGVAAKRGTACALRDAKLGMLREGKWKRAFYWGAFQVYAAGS
jgi:CHAT domain-containing protein